MSSVGIVASAGGAASVEVLREPFNNVSAWTSSGIPSIGAGRTGNAVTVDSASHIRYNIAGPSQSDTLLVGTAIKFRNFPISDTARVFAFRTGTDGAVESDSLQFTTTGRLEVWRQGAGVAFGTTASPVVTATWYYLELKIKISDTVGTVELRLNGTPVIGPLTGLDTRADFVVAPLFSQLRIAPGYDQVSFDDLYLTTGEGAAFQGSQIIV
jgi:hypothetical protein